MTVGVLLAKKLTYKVSIPNEQRRCDIILISGSSSKKAAVPQQHVSQFDSVRTSASDRLERLLSPK